MIYYYCWGGGVSFSEEHFDKNDAISFTVLPLIELHFLMEKSFHHSFSKQLYKTYFQKCRSDDGIFVPFDDFDHKCFIGLCFSTRNYNLCHGLNS